MNTKEAPNIAADNRAFWMRMNAKPFRKADTSSAPAALARSGCRRAHGPRSIGSYGCLTGTDYRPPAAAAS